jgi:hypothetical protein
MSQDIELCKILLRRLKSRITLAEQAADEARQICHDIQEIIFDAEDNMGCPIIESVLNKIVDEGVA